MIVSQKVSKKRLLVVLLRKDRELCPKMIVFLDFILVNFQKNSSNNVRA